MQRNVCDLEEAGFLKRRKAGISDPHAIGQFFFSYNAVRFDFFNG